MAQAISIDFPICELLLHSGDEHASPSTSDEGLLIADREDIRRSLDGDGEAFRRLVERYQKQVATMMWRFTRDPERQQELVQDVFVQAFMSLARYRAYAPFSHWLSRIATRAGYRFWQAQARQRAHEAEPIEEYEHLPAAPPEDLEPSEAASLLFRLLAQLPPRDRLVLTLRHVEDLSIEETAQRTGWSQTMVKVQAWRARGKLKRLFEKANQPSTQERRRPEAKQ